MGVIVAAPMTAMQSGCRSNRSARAGGKPVGGRKSRGVLRLHRGKPLQNVGEVFPHVDLQAPAVLHNGVEDRALHPGLAISNEQPVFLAELGRTDRVFHNM